jgi:hypothetical protein
LFPVSEIAPLLVQKLDAFVRPDHRPRSVWGKPAVEKQARGCEQTSFKNNSSTDWNSHVKNGGRERQKITAIVQDHLALSNNRVNENDRVSGRLQTDVIEGSFPSGRTLPDFPIKSNPVVQKFFFLKASHHSC